MPRVLLIQQRIDLGEELAGSQDAADVTELEHGFVAVARSFSERRRISYAAWREAGVSAAVLRLRTAWRRWRTFGSSTYQRPSDSDGTATGLVCAELHGFYTSLRRRSRPSAVLTRWSLPPPEARLATGVREAWAPGSGYAVSVHRRPDR